MSRRNFAAELLRRLDAEAEAPQPEYAPGPTRDRPELWMCAFGHKLIGDRCTCSAGPEIARKAALKHIADPVVVRITTRPGGGIVRTERACGCAICKAALEAPDPWAAICALFPGSE